MILKSQQFSSVIIGKRGFDFFCQYRGGKLALHPATPRGWRDEGSSYEVDYNKAFIYQAWPPRAWEMTKGLEAPYGEKIVKRIPYNLNITSGCRDVQRTETISVHVLGQLRHQLEELSDKIRMASDTGDVQRCVASSLKSRLLEDEFVASDQVVQ